MGTGVLQARSQSANPSESSARRTTTVHKRTSTLVPLNEERGAVETADRGLMLARQVWRYGVATGRVARDFTADLKGALSPYRGKHFAAITEPVKLGELLRAIDAS